MLRFSSRSASRSSSLWAPTVRASLSADPSAASSSSDVQEKADPDLAVLHVLQLAVEMERTSAVATVGIIRILATKCIRILASAY